MKLGKKGMLALSFVIGASLFVTTAFADMALRTGYDQFKDAIKHTSEWMASGENSYTYTMVYEARLNDEIIYANSDVTKVDAALQASESTNKLSGRDGTAYEDHSYRDEHIHARKSNVDERYHVTEYERGTYEWLAYDDPFQYDGAQDFERIFDALVGNLKDHLIVTDRADGGKAYRGSLSEAQVPALVNAVLSFLAKQAYLDSGRFEDQVNVKLEQDIHVRKIVGKAEENSDGLLEFITGEVVILGTDTDGKQHEIRLDFSYQLDNVGDTTVTKPDLTDAQVYRVNESEHGFSDKYIGTYRNDIVVDFIDDEFVKIGERTLEINHVDDDSISGRYYETIDPEYAEYFSREPLDFEFETEQKRWMTVFQHTGHDGEQYYGEIHPSRLAKISLYIYAQLEEDDYLSYGGELMEHFDNQFLRVFE